jgi:hypothetical protein
MDWIKRHLNWTLGLSYLILISILLAIMLPLFDFPDFTHPKFEGNFWVVMVIAALWQILYLGSIYFLNWWVLGQKKRSEYWLLVVFLVPLGFIGIIFLKNKSQQTAS